MKMKNMFSRMLKLASPRSSKRERWMEASDAKKQVQLILKHLHSQISTTQTLIDHLKSIIHTQASSGEDASSLAAHLYKLMSTKCALISVHWYCASILCNLPLLAQEATFSALPSTVQEAVASLMFASRRCASSSELVGLMMSLRELFKRRYGGAEREIESKVSERMRNEYFCDELGDEVKARLVKIVAGRGDLGLKFQLGKENDGEQNPDSLSWVYAAFESYEEDEHSISSSSEDDGHQEYELSDSDNDDEEQLHDPEERKKMKFQGLVTDLSWVRDFESYRMETIYLGFDQHQALPHEGE